MSIITSEQRSDIEGHADLLYSVYCEAVGGVAFNGDPLPTWESFNADANKRLQSDAWRSVAKQSLESEAECARLHTLWHAAEERANVATAKPATPHDPDDDFNEPLGTACKLGDETCESCQ